MQEAGEIAAVLHEDRVVESELAVELVDLLSGRPFGEDERGRLARHAPEHEGDGDRDEQGDQGLQDAADDVGHVISRG